MTDYPEYDKFLALSPAERKTMHLIEAPQAMAFAWIEAYAENLSEMVGEDDYGGEVTVHDLIDTGISNLGSEWGDYITRGGAFEGETIDPTFWDKLAILLGTEIPSDKRGNFFSCSC